MDHQHLDFAQLQGSSPSAPSFDPSSAHYIVYTNAAWPPMYQHHASVEQSQISPNRSVHQHHPHHHPSSSLDSLDYAQSSSHARLNQSLQSPGITLAPPAATSSIQATPVNVPPSMRLNPQLRGPSPRMDFSVSGGISSGQLGLSNSQIRTSVGPLRNSMPTDDATIQQALQSNTTICYPTNSLLSQYSGNFGTVHPPQIENLMSTAQATMQPGMSFVDPSAMNSLNSFAASTSALHFQTCNVIPNTFSDLFGDMTSGPYADSQLTTLSSPDQPLMASRSFSNHSDLSQSWHFINGLQDTHAAFSPVHYRSDSSSSHQSDHSPGSAASEGSFEEIMFSFTPEPEVAPDHSHTAAIPISDRHYYTFASYDSDYAVHSPLLCSPRSGFATTPVESQSAIHSPIGAASPLSANAVAWTSPKANRRISPPGITPKVIAKKKLTGSAPVREKSEKKVGRRRGPLRPEQREQAHEIRKVGACLRCKFLKKVCNPGNPCGGCKPSHARLWQVPCTRLDIKDIGYFIKNWNADHERHLSLAMSIANIVRIDSRKRLLYVTHGYGFHIPVWAQTVQVRDESCFGVDWVEQRHSRQKQDYKVQTARLCVVGEQGVTRQMVSDYVDRHLDNGFDHFVNEYFDGTPFLSELLKSINRHYLVTGQENLRKGLRFVIAYALTMHITMIEGLSEEEAEIGKIRDSSSRYAGSICAPVMINFVVKQAMADLWRTLMTEVLTELSALYTSGFAGQKKKSWPTTFMMAALLLTVWEMMQFDCHYRVREAGVASKFCETMEQVPVGVIVGLFAALSTRLPQFHEWDTQQHGNVFGDNQVVCNTMTEVRQNIEKNGMFDHASCEYWLNPPTEGYLRTRSTAQFCREDFDSLSNKFLSKLVIRA